jgi:hypothetical protein
MWFALASHLVSTCSIDSMALHIGQQDSLYSWFGMYRPTHVGGLFLRIWHQLARSTFFEKKKEGYVFPSRIPI